MPNLKNLQIINIKLYRDHKKPTKKDKIFNIK